MNNVSKARSTTIYFGDGISVEGYELPSGDYAVSITSASLVLGYAKNWLGRTIAKGGNTFKSLRGKGFSGKVSEVVTPSIGGNQTSKLISIKDFNRLIRYAAYQGKAEAEALADALMDMSLVDFFRDGFGERPLTIEEKRQNFYKAYANSLTRQDWMEMDRFDVFVIEEQLAFVGELA